MSYGSNLISGVHKKILVLPFNAVLAANTNNTLVAGKIPFWYRIREIEVVFEDDTNNQLLVYVFVSGNSTASTTTPPPDYNVFGQYSPTPYLIGEGIIKSLDIDYQVEKDMFYIKVYGSNLNAYAVTMNVTVKIEEI